MRLYWKERKAGLSLVVADEDGQEVGNEVETLRGRRQKHCRTEVGHEAGLDSLHLLALLQRFTDSSSPHGRCTALHLELARMQVQLTATVALERRFEGHELFAQLALAVVPIHRRVGIEAGM